LDQLDVLKYHFHTQRDKNKMKFRGVMGAYKKSGTAGSSLVNALDKVNMSWAFLTGTA